MVGIADEKVGRAVGNVVAANGNAEPRPELTAGRVTLLERPPVKLLKPNDPALRPPIAPVKPNVPSPPYPPTKGVL